MLYDAKVKKCSLPPEKVSKYINRVDKILLKKHTSSKELERLVGNLVWASYVEPWGRPFLSALSSKIQRLKPEAVIPVDEYTQASLFIWRSILKFNHGLSFNYILGRLKHGSHA